MSHRTVKTTGMALTVRNVQLGSMKTLTKAIVGNVLVQLLKTGKFKRLSITICSSCALHFQNMIHICENKTNSFSSSFSKACVVDGFGLLICTSCEVGYSGNRCET